MKKTFCIALVLLTFGLPIRAFALAGELKTPDLAFPTGFSEISRTNLLASLQPTDCKFLGGRFINWSTTLEYGGNTPALNRFLAGLAKCPEVVLVVRFGPAMTASDCDWAVTHSAQEPSKVVVHINWQSSAINMEDIALPEWKGPPIAKGQ